MTRATWSIARPGWEGRAIAGRARRRLSGLLFDQIDRQEVPAHTASCNRAQWAIYNLFMRKASRTEHIDSIAPATPEPSLAPHPPILPVKREWREAVLEALDEKRPAAAE